MRKYSKRVALFSSIAIVAVAVSFFLLVVPHDKPIKAVGEYPELINVSSTEQQGNYGSDSYAFIGANGRYVAFSSTASNLVSGDNNNVNDIFVRDRQSGTTERVSIATNGTEQNDQALKNSISANGRYVAFSSMATNLAPGDSPGTWDVFVHDRQTGTTVPVSNVTGGNLVHGGNDTNSISADGRYVAFNSSASNLVQQDNNATDDIFVRDRQTGMTERVSVATNGTEGNAKSDYANISSDGRYVAFISLASNFFSGDTSGTRDTFIHDRQSGITEHIGSGDKTPELSADGRYVIFGSSGTLYLRDRQSNTTEFISNNASYHSISGNGRFVSYSTVYPSPTSVFVHDRQTGITEYIANGHRTTLSSDGHFIGFATGDPLVPGDVNNAVDVYITLNPFLPAPSFNTPPTVGVISVSTNPVLVESTTTATASFNDPEGTLDAPYTVEWDWGDGNVTTESVNQPGSISKDHTYTSAGVYEIMLTVTASDYGSDFETFQYLSVYNPTPQGLFSAGQKYSSPAGAYPQEPEATGNVMFGLNYKYQGEIPVSNRQFIMDFKTANFEFNATSINSLVIANGIGTLRGTGTINGQGTYNFLVVGKEYINTIRIQIKDLSGNTIYDTQSGFPDTAEPTIPTTAGIVLAH